jgi:dTDP-glucose 4,6-dehydratase/UDP-glucose 4-epimerase
LPFPIQGDGTETRAFVHIDDFTDGLIHVIEKGKHMNIYHIGNPEEISIGDVARKVAAHFGRKAEIVPGKPMEGGTRRRCPNIDKLRGLGFKPRISFDEGLPSVANWYRDHADLKPNKG